MFLEAILKVEILYKITIYQSWFESCLITV